MVIGSQTGASNYIRNDSETAITTVPQAAEGKKAKDAAISQGPSICMFDKGDSQQEIASWLFLKYLTTTVELQAEFGLASGYVPVLKSVTQNPVYKAAVEKANGGENIAALSAKVCMEQADAYYTSPAFVGSSTARDQVGALLEAVVTGSKTVDKAFQDAMDECEYSI